MGVKNPADTVVTLPTVIDAVRAKSEGTRLATIPWRSATPNAAEELPFLTAEALYRCDDVTDAIVVVTVAVPTVAYSLGLKSRACYRNLTKAIRLELQDLRYNDHYSRAGEAA